MCEARRLFVEHGYRHTSMTMILNAAGLSKGALYHHFASKEDMFAAIFEDVSRRAIERAVAKTGKRASPLETLSAVVHAWLAELRDPETAAILLEQGPQVLGWRRAKQIEDANSLGAMTRSLERAVESGEIAVQCPHVAARMLNALLAEAAFISLDREDSRIVEAEAMIARFVTGLK